ncbi:hypothetical protein B0H21DRAFT_2250 [Amylocystis lapponica]|nr:hypothetical protein B0H21DRAFT_2250 [Amylocystis lapponica]
MMHPSVCTDTLHLHRGIEHAVAVTSEVRVLEEKRERIRRLQKSRYFQNVGNDARDMLDDLRNETEAELRARRKRHHELIGKLESADFLDASQEDTHQYIRETRAWLDTVIPVAQQMCDAIMQEPPPLTSGLKNVQEAMAKLEIRMDDLEEYAAHVYHAGVDIIDQQMDDLASQLLPQNPSPGDSAPPSSITTTLTGAEAARHIETIRMHDWHTRDLARAMEDIKLLKAHDLHRDREFRELRAQHDHLKHEYSSLKETNESQQHKMEAYEAELKELRAMLEGLSVSVPRVPTIEELSQRVQNDLTPRVRGELIGCVGLLHSGVEMQSHKQQQEIYMQVWTTLQPALRFSETVIHFMEGQAANDTP